MEQWKDDETADAAFRSLLATLPAIEPSPGFVQQTVAAAWQVRRRRRQVRAAGLATAAALLVGIALAFTVGAPGWLLLTGAQAAAGFLMTLLASATAMVEFWAVLVHAGTALARVLVMPQSVVTLVVIEFIGAAALYTLHHLLRNDVRLGNSGPLCL